MIFKCVKPILLQLTKDKEYVGQILLQPMPPTGALTPVVVLFNDKHEWCGVTLDHFEPVTPVGCRFEKCDYKNFF